MEIRAMKDTTLVLPDPLPETFNELNMIHQLRPIRDGVDYDNAVAVLDRLAVLNSRNQDQEDYLETLAELIAKYDGKHYAFDYSSITPLVSLSYLMKENNIDSGELSVLLKEDLNDIQNILNGSQELSKTHIRILSDRFKVNPSLFL